VEASIWAVLVVRRILERESERKSKGRKDF
jgi:hypothetical protein